MIGFEVKKQVEPVEVYFMSYVRSYGEKKSENDTELPVLKLNNTSQFKDASITYDTVAHSKVFDLISELTKDYSNIGIDLKNIEQIHADLVRGLLDHQKEHGTIFHLINPSDAYLDRPGFLDAVTIYDEQRGFYWLNTDK